MSDTHPPEYPQSISQLCRAKTLPLMRARAGHGLGQNVGTCSGGGGVIIKCGPARVPDSQGFGKGSVHSYLRPGLSSLWTWHELGQTPPVPQISSDVCGCLLSSFSSLRLSLGAAGSPGRPALRGAHLDPPWWRRKETPGFTDRLRTAHSRCGWSQARLRVWCLLVKGSWPGEVEGAMEAAREVGVLSGLGPVPPSTPQLALLVSPHHLSWTLHDFQGTWLGSLHLPTFFFSLVTF